MYSALRPLLFLLEGEVAHHVTLGALKWRHRLGLHSHRVSKPVSLLGIDFPNPIGLAAGLDKNADYLESLAALGFGFVEVGTVTPRPQPGNPRPRIFRLPRQQALINRMGFNNKGLGYVVERLRQTRFRGVLGVNIGKNKDTPNERAIDDYLLGLDGVYPFASYVTVNISSPNTAGLRDLQQREPMTALLGALRERRDTLARRSGRHVPLLVKVAPDLERDDIDMMAQAISDSGCDGVIATNTTLDRSAVAENPLAEETGGLSGAPLSSKATEVLRAMRSVLPEGLPLIGSGGVMTPEDALAKHEAGADLVQLYTGLIYAGPKLITRCAEAWPAPSAHAD